MIINHLPPLKLNPGIKVSLILLFLLLSALNLQAQTPTVYSGKWEFDKARSDKDETGDYSFEGTIILDIKQDASTISFANTFKRPGKEDFVIPPDSFFLDGRVTTDNEGTGPAKKFVKWSADKKILTTSYVMTDKIDGVAQDFTTANSYKLSDDGKTLNVSELNKSKLNGEKTIKKVYKKILK
jgi:hypothetical protein